MQRNPETVDNQPCLCGSGDIFSECCKRYVARHEHVPTAEKLMRSRYSAYLRGIEDYLLKTWHTSTRPAQLNLVDEEGLNWLGLRILSCEKGGSGDVDGSVEFIAEYEVNGEHQQLYEKSRFVKENGQWYYLDGNIQSLKRR